MRTDASASFEMVDGRSRESGLPQNPSGAAFSAEPPTPTPRRALRERRVPKARQSRERRVAILKPGLKRCRQPRGPASSTASESHQVVKPSGGCMRLIQMHPVLCANKIVLPKERHGQ